MQLEFELGPGMKQGPMVAACDRLMSINQSTTNHYLNNTKQRRTFVKQQIAFGFSFLTFRKKSIHKAKSMSNPTSLLTYMNAQTAKTLKFSIMRET